MCIRDRGIYIFSWKKLREYLERDEATPDSDNDFGKNIIPAMLGEGQRMCAYPFEGYWKDVGTIDSLWEANICLLYTSAFQSIKRPPRNSVCEGLLYLPNSFYSKGTGPLANPERDVYKRQVHLSLRPTRFVGSLLV